MSDSNPNSQPPQAKIIAAWSALLMGVFASLTELAGIVAATYGLLHDKLNAMEWGLALAACLTGKVGSQLRNKLPVPALVAGAGVAASAAKSIAPLFPHALLPFMLVPLVVLSGCSTLAPLAPIAADAMKALLPSARDALVKEAERRDTDLDANEAICFAAPEEYQPDDYLLVTCIAPESESDE